MTVRSSDSKTMARFRCNRFYHTPQGWWFSSRDHNEEGPFETLKRAESSLSAYLIRVELADDILAVQIVKKC